MKLVGKIFDQAGKVLGLVAKPIIALLSIISGMIWWVLVKLFGLIILVLKPIYQIVIRPIFRVITIVLGPIARPVYRSKLFYPIRKLLKYFEDSYKELQKVNWPTAKEAWELTYIILVFTALLTAFIVAADYIFGQLMQSLFL